MAGRVETLTSAAYPILEFDTATDAVLEPSRIIHRLEGLPERAVICFFQEVIEQACGAGQATIATHLRSEIGAHPVYDFDPGGGRHVVVFHPGVGAPLAAGLMEEVIALGCRAFVACGGAGALIPGLALGHVIVPTAAVRDEGTSYHYLPPDREVAADPRDVAVAVGVLDRHDVPHLVAKTWTTNAIYRETAAKIAGELRGVRHRGDGDRRFSRCRSPSRRDSRNISTQATTSVARRGPSLGNPLNPKRSSFT